MNNLVKDVEVGSNLLKYSETGGILISLSKYYTVVTL